jgi:hypothetical protein
MMRLTPLVPDSIGLISLRRKAIATVGAIGLLALSGSQAMAPGPVAFLKAAAAAEPMEGESYYYDSMWAGAPNGPVQIQALDAGPASDGPRPYGYTSSAAFTASGIPEPAYRAYVNAAADLAHTDPSCKISWSLIAGIGRVESNHGRFGGSTIRTDGLITPPILGIRLDGSRPGTASIHDTDNGRYDGDPVYDRAVGPMQFLPGTWKTYGDGADPQNMNAAALATARYLCAGGGALDTQPGRWAAVYRYNHSDSYVSLVLSIADAYATGHPATFPTRPAGTPPPDTGPPATTPGAPPAVPPAPPLPSSGTPTSAPTGWPTSGPTTGPTTGPTEPATTAGPTTTPPADPATTAPSSTNPPDSTSTQPSPSSEPSSDPAQPPSPTDSPSPADSPAPAAVSSAPSGSSATAESSPTPGEAGG